MECTRVSVIEQIGYREWTESLGDDREWIIQETQATIYRELQSRASKLNGFVLPTRYDYMILISSGIDRGSHESLIESLKPYARVPLRMASVCAPTPLKAEEDAWSLLRDAKPWSVSFRTSESRESVVVAHLDIDNIMGATRKRGAVRTYYMILNLVSDLSVVAAKNGALLQYLGGDNILLILPINGFLDVVESIISRVDSLKAGVGVSSNARTALSLAARALHEIRSSRDKRIVVYGDASTRQAGMTLKDY